MQTPLPFDVASPVPGNTAPNGYPGGGDDASAAAPEFVRHPRARRYVVRVRTDGTVRVTIPRWGTRRDAQAFVDTQQAWISKQRARLAAAKTAEAPMLSIDEARQLRQRATRELPERLLTLARKLGLTVTRVSVRNQRWRWGSCSKSGHICLNWRLVAMPDWVCDYVLLHELMHLKRMDHSPRFWKLVAAVCPTFKEARDWLRQHQSLLDSST